jgi:predicted RNase H-like HicB family nuclease
MVGTSCRSRSFPQPSARGRPWEEALANIREAAELYLEDATEDELAALDAHPVTATVRVGAA